MVFVKKCVEVAEILPRVGQSRRRAGARGAPFREPWPWRGAFLTVGGLALTVGKVSLTVGKVSLTVGKGLAVQSGWAPRSTFLEQP